MIMEYFVGVMVGAIFGSGLVLCFTAGRKSPRPAEPSPDTEQRRLAFKTQECNDVFYRRLKQGYGVRPAAADADAAVAAWEERFPEAWKVFTK